MDGHLTIIDGEPGNGKTIQSVRLMIESVRRGHNIATNVAMKPKFTQYVKKWAKKPLQIINLNAETTKEFWKHVPPGYDIFIDEAHLMWTSKDWNKNRTDEFMAYISQFRKDGDTIYLLAQNFSNLDKFIRQRADSLITCRVWRTPGFLPDKWARKPMLFWVRNWKVQDAEKTDAKGLPKPFTPGMNAGIYELYDTRGKVALPGQAVITRPTEAPPQTPDANQPAAAAPQVVVNVGDQTPKKTHWKLKALGIAIAATLVFSVLPGPTKSKQTAKREIAAETNSKTAKDQAKKSQLYIYGTINRTAILQTGDKITGWPIGESINGATLQGVNIDGANFVLKHGHTRVWHEIPYYHPKPKKQHHDKPTTGSPHLPFSH